MASYYEYICEKCSKSLDLCDDSSETMWQQYTSRKRWSFSINTSGPHEFIGDESNIHNLSHPGRSLANGLYLNVYCTMCKDNSKLVIVKYKKPSNPFATLKDNICKEYLKNYAGYIEAYPALNIIETECFNYDAIHCPKCNSPHIINREDGLKHGVVLYKPFDNVIYNCPICDTGKMTGRETMIT